MARTRLALFLFLCFIVTACDSGGGAAEDASGGACGRTPESGCCFADDDCGADMVCRGVGGCTTAGAGRCLPRAGAGQCWGGGDCEDICEGGFFCPCGERCGAPDIPGLCRLRAGCSVAATPGCCFEDSDCPTGQQCHGALCRPGGEGVCKEPSAMGCWSDRDCATTSEVCSGGSVCPCGADCLVPDEPGSCTTP